MATFTTKDHAEIWYKDWGTGPVVTFGYSDFPVETPSLEDTSTLL